MLLPYNVDRSARRFPWVTYALIAINILIFFFTILVANVNLPSDRLLAAKAQQQLLARVSLNSREGQAIAAIEAVYPEALPQADGSSAAPAPSPGQEALQATVRHTLTLEQARRQIWQISLQLAAQHINDPQGYARFWQIQHMHDRVVWEPHYSTLSWMAYHPAEPSAAKKLLGLFGSMFLHGGVMHVLGNMFFLWVFGRAVEDALGSYIYLGAYLLCGVAAALLQHIITMVFTPAFLSVPLLGASGAVSGVLGFFAPRFYRTPVRTFYVLPYALPLLVIVTLLLGLFLNAFLGDPAISFFFALIAAGAGMYFWGRTWCWGTFRLAAAWWLAFYIVFFNLVPGITGLLSANGGGGVAHWAHIGGFGVGMLYAFLIGSTSEGKREFDLEDARKYYDEGDFSHAIAAAQHLIATSNSKASAMEVLGKSLAAQKRPQEAQNAFAETVALYIKQGDRSAAARTYLLASSHFPPFVLPAATQMTVGSTIENEGDYSNAVAALEKIVHTHPAAPEAEMALLRCARIYGLHLGDAARAQLLLSQFHQKFPHSAWTDQARQLATQIQNRQPNVAQ